MLKLKIKVDKLKMLAKLNSTQFRLNASQSIMNETLLVCFHES